MMNSQVLLLNQDYQAIAICTAERAFVLVYLHKADIIETYVNKQIRTASKIFEYPSIIRLKRYVHIPFRKVSLTRVNIFKRDGNQCAYCLSKFDLTIDHILPKSMGGRDTWENLITACQTCNTKKGNHTPEEAGMELLLKPFKPNYIFYLINFKSTINDGWKPYLMMN